MGLKSKIYTALKISNDINSIMKGKAHKRIGRRISGKMSGKAMKKLFK